MPVDVFDRGESIGLLRRRVPQLTAGDAARIADALGDLPLALSQAAAHLADTGMPADDYLIVLDKRAAELLAHGTPATYPTSLAASTQLALDRLAAQVPAALDLLMLAAQLAPEPIPLTLFTAHPDQLARIKPGTLQVHRLIQAILRNQPNSHDMATLAIRLLRVAVPDEPFDNPPAWPAWRQFLPHILTATDTFRIPDPTGDDVAWLLCQAGGFVLARGEPASARSLLERALNLRRSALGEDHPETLVLASNLAVNLRRLGQHEQARDLAEDTLVRRRRILGEDHPDTLASANNLAADLRALGRDDEASELEEWVRSRR